MGRHAAVGRKRGVAGWPLLVLGLIVLLVAGTITYFAVLRNEDRTTAGRCTGSVTLPILAASGSSPAARALSDAFNATNPAARSTCLTTTVTTMTSPDATAALIAHWAGRDDDAPGVWITDDGSALAEVDKQASDLTAGRDADPIATSPVVLAMAADDSAAADGLAWTDLGSAFGTGGTVTRADGTAIELLLPDPRSNRSSVYALTSALGGPDASLDASTAEAGAAAFAADAAPDSALPTTGDALHEIATGTVAGAVPVTEADLARFNAGAGADLAAVYPSGPTAGDEVYVVSLTGDWMTPTLRDAATRLRAFAGSDAGLAILAAANLRVDSPEASSAAGIDPERVVTALPAADPEIAAALAAGLGLDGPPAVDPAGSAVESPEPTSEQPQPSESTSSGSTSSGSTPSGSTPSGSTPSASNSDAAASSSRSVVTGTTGIPAETAVSGAPTTSTVPTAAVSSSTVSSSTNSSTTASSSTASSPAKSSSAPAPTTPATSSTVVVAPGPNVTLLVDTSATWNTVVEGQTRLEWLQQALTGVVDEGADRGIGLWAVGSTYSDGYSIEVPTGPLTAAVEGGQVRSAELGSAIAALGAGGSRRNYGAVPVALTEAAKTATQEQPHVVILVTDGGDQTPSVSRATVIGQIRNAIAGTPTTLSILGVGESAPDSALQDLAEAGDGRYYDVRSTTYLPDMLLQAVEDATS